jgi:hypothetical protein
MKVIVYFECGGFSEVVAKFSEEEIYLACLPALKEMAREGGYVISESVDYEEVE